MTLFVHHRKTILNKEGLQAANLDIQVGERAQPMIREASTNDNLESVCLQGTNENICYSLLSKFFSTEALTKETKKVF